MLPGNHKDMLPLICFTTTFSHHFFVFSLYIVNLHLFLSISVCSELPPPRSSLSNRFDASALLSSLARNLLFPEPSTEGKRIYFSGKLGQYTNAHFLGAYLGTKSKLIPLEGSFHAHSFI